MKSNTKIALILTASVISCSAFAQSVSAPKTDSLLSNILGEQVQTNQHLVQLLAKDQNAGLTLTRNKRKPPACMKVVTTAVAHSLPSERDASLHAEWRNPDMGKCE